MSRVHEERKVIVTMNPDELRKLADDMERKYPKKLPGESTFIGLLACTSSLQVCLHADQFWVPKQESGEE